MPIANCLVKKGCYQKVSSSDSLIDLWAAESGLSSQQMTVNITQSSEQRGNAYNIMAVLYLPSLWSKQDINLLQTGLAYALTRYFNVDINTVHVITHILQSGMVVEHGEIVEWK
jgi:hypothetical protein